MADFGPVEKILNITPAIRDRHHYHLDTAFRGRYARRLPDRSLVYTDEYEEKLKEYEMARGDSQAHE